MMSLGQPLRVVTLRAACAGVAAFVGGAPLHAQTVAPAARPAAPAVLASTRTEAPAPAASAPSLRSAADGLRVIEDDDVRIEEMHVRGEVKSVTVRSKVGGAKPYEVLVRRGGSDPSQDKSAAGHSVWSLFSF